jgi:hypothetical protein
VDNSTRIAIAAGLLCLLILVLAPRARASAGIRVLGEPGVENKFPDGLVFTLEAESEAEIREIRLRYRFIPDNLPATAQPEFERGARISATFNLRSGTRQIYIPPGKTIRYSWEITDTAGNEIKTEEKETTFADPRFDWQMVNDGIVNLYYYRQNQRDAEVMAQVANETITKAAALMGAKFDFPIKMWAYANATDFQIALAHSSVTHDPNVLGQAHDPDTFIMVVDRLSSPTALDTARHELAHLVTANALRGGPFKDLYPAWLNEGTSVYLQVSPNDVGYIDALEDAIENDKTLPLRSLTSGTRARDIGLFYGQSYGLVKYLVQTFGDAKFAQMIAEFKKNGDLDQTFKAVYGFDRDGLYREWRKSVGLPENQAAGGGGQQQSPARSGQQSDDSSTIVLAIGGTVALLLLAAAAVAGGLLLARRAHHGEAE